MPRRCHTKSRQGCIQCKQRRVKCDEHRPSCSLCIKRGLECTYVAPLPRRKPSMAVKESGDPGKSSLPDSNGIPRLPRLLELRLYHHAITDALPSLAKDEVDLEFWQSVAPKIASAHDYVMDGLLAVAALHLAFIDAEPVDCMSWTEVALRYQSLAITGLRQSLARDSQDIDATLICSGFILVSVTAYKSICQDVELDPLKELMTVRSLLGGTVFLWLQVYHSKGKTSMDRWVHRADEEDPNIMRQREDPVLVKLHGEILEKLKEVRTVIEQSQDSNKEAYIKNYDSLWQTIDSWPTGRGSMSWSLQTTDSFLNLATSGHWIPRILIMFHGLGMHLSSRKWFAQKSGLRYVQGMLAPVEGSIPPEWVNLINWIKKAVEI